MKKRSSKLAKHAKRYARAAREIPAQKSKSVEEIVGDRQAFARCGNNRELYEAIHGAPGEFPAME